MDTKIKLRFFTLGPFDLYIEGVPEPLVHWGSRTARSLGKMLITYRDQPIAKDQLQAWLWPMMDMPATRRLLDAAFQQVRRLLALHLPPDDVGRILHDGGDYLILRMEEVWVDVEVLYEAAQVDIASPQAVATLEAADDLYCGVYLSNDLHAPWAERERQRVADAYEQVLHKLAYAYELRGQYRAATLACKSLLLFNPGSVNAIIQLSRCHELAQLAETTSASLGTRLATSAR